MDEFYRDALDEIELMYDGCAGLGTYAQSNAVVFSTGRLLAVLPFGFDVAPDPRGAIVLTLYHADDDLEIEVGETKCAASTGSGRFFEWDVEDVMPSGLSELLEEWSIDD